MSSAFDTQWASYCLIYLLCAAKGRAKKKKGAFPPPLLLIQDAKTTLMRLQDRVSALLLRSRDPSPPTPTRCPSSLPNLTGAALLWQKSALLDGDSACHSDFYAAELKQFFTSLETVKVRNRLFHYILDLFKRGCLMFQVLQFRSYWCLVIQMNLPI